MFDGQKLFFRWLISNNVVMYISIILHYIIIKYIYIYSTLCNSPWFDWLYNRGAKSHNTLSRISEFIEDKQLKSYQVYNFIFWINLKQNEKGTLACINFSVCDIISLTLHYRWVRLFSQVQITVKMSMQKENQVLPLTVYFISCGF